MSLDWESRLNNENLDTRFLGYDKNTKPLLK